MSSQVSLGRPVSFMCIQMSSSKSTTCSGFSTIRVTASDLICHLKVLLKYSVWIKVTTTQDSLCLSSCVRMVTSLSLACLSIFCLIMDSSVCYVSELLVSDSGTCSPRSARRENLKFKLCCYFMSLL